MNLDKLNYLQFFDNARLPVLWCDRDGSVIYVNTAAAGLLGYTEKELLGRKLADIDSTLSPGAWEEFLEAVVHGDRKRFDTFLSRSDGSRIAASLEYSTATQGDDVYICAFVCECTVDDQSRQPMQLLSSAVQISQDAFFLNSKDGRILYVNQSACDMLGYSYEELVCMKTSDIDHGEVIDEQGNVRINDMALEDKQGVFESQHWRKDGSVIPVEVSYNNLTVGGIEYSYAFSRDITERRELERQREKLWSFVDNSFDAVYIYDREGKISYANTTAVTETGYSLQELLSMSIMDLDPSVTEEIWQGGWQNEGQGRDILIESVHRRKDGSEYPVEISFSLSSTEGDQYALSYVRNITDRKQATREADELRSIIDNSIDEVMIYDRNGSFYYVNNTACDVMGYTRDEFLQLTIFDIVHGHTREKHNQYREQRNGRMRMLESVHKTKDGRLIPVEVSVHTTKIGGKGYSCAFVRDITDRKEAMLKLEELQFAIDNSIVPIYFYDKDGNITYANKSACRALEYTFEELTGLTVFDIDATVTEEIWKDLYENVKAGRGGTIPSINIRKDGSTFPVEVTPTNMTFGDLEFGCSVNIDVSGRAEAEKAVRESEEKFRLIADTSPVALIIYRVSDGIILYANKTAMILFRRVLTDITNHTITSLFENHDTREEFSRLLENNDQVYGHELMLSDSESNPLWVSLNAKTISLHGEQVVCLAMQDITEAHKLSLQLSYQASYDALTGLVNRREFESRLHRVIKTAEQNRTDNALCYLDLDQFKVINDTCGHIAGDELLRQVANVLQSQIRKRDTLARLGGDEFAVLLENCSLQQAKRVANAIRDAVQEYRFVWDDKSFTIGVSIGLVPIDLRDENITDVLRRADTACYQAKENGRNRIHVYHPADEELTLRHGEMQWVTRISSALEKDRLQLWAQKIIPIDEPGAQGEHYELLLRMIDDNNKMVPPGAFLPAAERYNLIPRVDRWVVGTALQWFANYPDKYQKLNMCSINLSGQSLSDEELLQEIIDRFNKYGLSPEKFCFEVTETAAIANLNYATKFIHSLKQLGCSFALDDFGSGLSSFAYLKNLPVDFIKIDGQFIKDLHTDPMHLALVKSINDVGHVLGKKTIAEFVENKKILKKLKELGVDYAQGFGIAKPTLMIEGLPNDILAN